MNHSRIIASCTVSVNFWCSIIMRVYADYSAQKTTPETGNSSKNKTKIKAKKGENYA